jgi:hypothetical protein
VIYERQYDHSKLSQTTGGTILSRTNRQKTFLKATTSEGTDRTFKTRAVAPFQRLRIASAGVAVPVPPGLAAVVLLSAWMKGNTNAWYTEHATLAVCGHQNTQQAMYDSGGTALAYTLRLRSSDLNT